PSRGRSGNQDLAAAVVLSEPNSAADLDQVGESEAEEKGGPAAKAATVAHAEQRDAVPARGATDRAATPVREGAAGVGDHETREATPAAPIPFRTPSPAALADRPDAPAPAPEWVGTLLRENRETQEAQSQMGAELRAQAAVMTRVVENQSAQLRDDRDRERRLHDEITRLHAEITRLQAQTTHLHATLTQQITLLQQYHEVLAASRGLTLLPPPATPGEMDRPSAIPHPFPRP
ncbi:MAG TPA: hypothetical protein VNL71_03050, partial [Chloroflexota bacterium]|nr:hypothetical protein [Chloroflexota bacterium]